MRRLIQRRRIAAGETDSCEKSTERTRYRVEVSSDSGCWSSLGASGASDPSRFESRLAFSSSDASAISPLRARALDMAGRTRLYAMLMLVVVLLSCGGSGVLAQATNGTTSLRPTASVSGNSTSVSATPMSNVTSSVSSTTIATISSSAAVSASPSASSPPFLDTRVEGWNGAAGALMILSGLALGLAGVRSRW